MSAVATYAVMRSARHVARQDFAIAVPSEVNHLAISSDGKWLAYVSPGDTGLPKVYVQRIGSTDVRALAGTEGASYPFWSPDDAYIAFFANNKMQKVAVAGGEPQTITPVSGAPRGGSWGSKGVIIHARGGGALWRVNADGGDPRSFTDKSFRPGEQGDVTHRWPVFLPDGDHFLMFAGNFAAVKGQNRIVLSSLSKGEGKELVSTESSAGCAEGSVYYLNDDGALMAAKLDVDAGKLEGAPRVIASQVGRSPSTFYGVFAASSNATVVYSTSIMPTRSQFTWIDETGRELGRIGSPGVLANPSISPDGKRVAFDSEDFKANNVDVWISDLERDASSRFTFAPTEEVGPVWSRDGSTIAYRNIQPMAIHLKKANGLEPDRALSPMRDQTSDIIPNSWGPGDREVLCALQNTKGRYELMLVPADGGKPHPLMNGSGNETNGQFSPDGKWVAYASDETGKSEIYVTSFPGAAGKWQVSRGGGTEPRWRRDGKAIFYIGPGQMLTEAEVSTGDSFSAGIPRPLFQMHTRAPISSTDLFNYDVAPDGKRFLVNQYIKPDQPPPLRIVLNAGAAQ